MNKALTLTLVVLVTALGVWSCGRGNVKESRPPVADKARPPSAAKDKVTPVEATTTQGSKIVFPGGDISWADAVVSFKPGDPAPKRSRDPKAALGKPDYRGTEDAEDEATYVSLRQIKSQ